MQVDKQTYRKWKLKKEHGDVGRIHEASGVSRQAISRCITGGYGDANTIDAINKFYGIETKETETESKA